MFDDDESFNTDELSILEMFPFFQSFPFEAYQFKIEAEGVLNENKMLDPVILKAGGGFVEPDLVHFSYSTKLSNISLSFYTYDIKYIHESAHKITKLDDMAKLLNMSIIEEDFKIKIKAIRAGEKMLKKLGTDLSASSTFSKILDELIELNGISISKKDLKLIKSLSLQIEQSNYDPSQRDVISDFYNLHLHHINIVLGIVIATKIHL